jgi:hypothetical protein
VSHLDHADAGDAPDEPAGFVVDVIVAAEVAGIVVGDGEV